MQLERRKKPCQGRVCPPIRRLLLQDLLRLLLQRPRRELREGLLPERHAAL